MNTDTRVVAAPLATDDSRPPTTPLAEPYWLADVRLRALRRTRWLRAWWSDGGYGDRTGDDESGLAISHSEVDRALADPTALAAEERAFYARDPQARQLTTALRTAAARRASAPADPWDHTVDLLGLTAPEENLLALTLATEANPALRRVYGYLHDDVQPADASPGLAACLWSWPPGTSIGPGSGLVRWGLARPVVPPGGWAWSRWCGWQADPTLLDRLLRGRPLSPPAADHPPATVLFPEIAAEIAAFVTAMAGPDDAAVEVEAVEVEVVGQLGSGRGVLIAQVARALERPLVAVDAASLTEEDSPETAAVRHCRDALLSGALLAWRGAEALPPQAWRAARGLVPVTFLTTTTRLPPPSGLPPRSGAGVVRRSFTLPPLARAERLTLWPLVGGRGPAPEPVAEWPLRAGEVTAVARASQAGPTAAREVARSLLAPLGHELLTPMPLPYIWDDLVVPERVAGHLRELAEQARRRGEVLDDWGFGHLTAGGRGLTALFAGPSGTGKTMAAQVLARVLGRELYRVDLAGVVDKYIGETEKRLRSVFDACERTPAVLFFDEADALFGRRTQVTDAHDRFANIQVDYLLQRMERFDGLAVLASNRKGDLDEAFTRRLRMVVDFVHPASAERERLWRLCLDGRGRVGELDFAALARELDLTGAGIKSAALAAVFLARVDGVPVGMRHVVAAARRELAKQGAVLRPGVLGPGVLGPGASGRTE